MNISDDDDKDSIMRQERTSRCGWEVLTRRSQPNNPEDDDDDAGTAPGSPNIRVSETFFMKYFQSEQWQERGARGVLSWLNLMSDNEQSRDNRTRRLARSLPRLDDPQPPSAHHHHQETRRVRSRTQELCDRWNGLSLDIDEILEAPLDNNHPHTAASTADRDHQPFIQTEWRPGVVPQGYKAEPLHLFHTIR